MTTQIIFAGISFLLMVITGVVLSRLGRPLNKAVFAFHKIFSLLTIVLLVLVALPHLKVVEWGSTLMIAALLSGAMLLVSFVSGALLSFENVMPKFVTIIHRISSVMVIVNTIATAWMMLT
jgi:hypothetical protein